MKFRPDCLDEMGIKKLKCQTGVGTSSPLLLPLAVPPLSLRPFSSPPLHLEHHPLN